MKELTADRVLEKTFTHLKRVLNEEDEHGSGDFPIPEERFASPRDEQEGMGEKERIEESEPKRE